MTPANDRMVKDTDVPDSSIHLTTQIDGIVITLSFVRGAMDTDAGTYS